VSITAVPFELTGADARPIRGDAFVNSEATASVVLCHGLKGFARGGFFPFLTRRLNDAGFTVVTFDFSGSGVGDDRENFTDLEAFAADTFTNQLHDVDVVWREGQRRGWLSQPTGLFGFSRGGGIAILHAAANPRVRALVTWSAISSVNRWSAEVRQAWRARGYGEVENTRTKQVMRVSTAILDDIEQNAEGGLDILGAANRITVPWLIVHGTADETVPVHEGRQLHTASGDRAELALVERGTHTFNSAHGVVDPPPELAAATDRTIRFFQSNLEA
jgi:pimeloyl-ACP methyl ester carboxylesterase